MSIPSQESKETIYKHYLLIYESNFSIAKKRALFRAIIGYESWSWRVVGISEFAIKELARNNFRRTGLRLERAHIIGANEIFQKIINRKLPFDEWWDLVWDNDKTILMTSNEHRSNNPSQIYSVNENSNLFESRYVGFSYAQPERDFVKQLVIKNNIKY